MITDLTALETIVESLYVRAVNDHRHYDALIAAVFAYLAAHAEKDSETEKATLGLIKATVELILHREHKVESSECSFCGLKPPEVKLIGGGDAYICSSCLRELGRISSDG